MGSNLLKPICLLIDSKSKDVHICCNYISHHLDAAPQDQDNTSLENNVDLSIGYCIKKLVKKRIKLHHRVRKVHDPASVASEEKL